MNVYNNFSFIGARSHKKLSYWYSAVDLLAIPSRYETFCLVALEGASCGLPSIAYNVGGISELMRDGETGFLIEKGSSIELFEKISLLLNNLERSKEMGKKGRNFVKDNFNLDKICNDFLNHLKKHGIGDI